MEVLLNPMRNSLVLEQQRAVRQLRVQLDPHKDSIRAKAAALTATSAAAAAVHSIAGTRHK